MNKKGIISSTFRVPTVYATSSNTKLEKVKGEVKQKKTQLLRKSSRKTVNQSSMPYIYATKKEVFQIKTVFTYQQRFSQITAT